MSAMFHPKTQAHYNNVKNCKRDLDFHVFFNKTQRKVSCTNEVPQVHTDSFGSGKNNFRSSCEIYRCDVPLESYPGLSYHWAYVWKLFESWKEVIGSGHLYRFFKNGKERFREISEDETIPKEFITFYVIDMSGTFDKTCLLGRNKDIDVTTEVIDLSKHEFGLKIKVNALIIKQDAQKLAIKELEKHTELTEPFVRDVQQSGDSAFSTVEQGTEFEEKVEEIFERKMMKLLQTMAEFIKPIIPEDVGDVDFHLIHDKDKLFRTITAELLVPVPGTLRNGKIRAMRHERRLGRKQRSSKQIPQCQDKLEQKSTLAKVEFKVLKYLINGLMKRFQLPYAVLIEYLSKFDIICELFSPIQADTRRIFTKQFLPNKLKTSLVALMRRVEKAVEKDMNFFRSIKKLYFLLCGMLVEYDNKWKVPSVRLTEKVRRELLSINAISSSGSFYGDLTFFVTKPLTKSNKKMINKVLQANKIKRGYVIRLIKNRTAYGGNDVNKCSALWFRRKDGDMEHTTLGCFVNIKRNEDTQLHAVSCIHRDPIINNPVYLDSTKGNVLGHESFGMRKRFTKDIVVIRIVDDMAKRYLDKMRANENKCSNHWGFFHGKYNGKKVYKFGYDTGLTEGVVLGEDDTEGYEPNGAKEDECLTRCCNFLVSTRSVNPTSGSVNNTTKFSNEGDSGAAVCWKSKGNVEVLGLLTGGFEDTEEEMHISYCMKFEPAIQELQKENGIIISPE